MFFFFNDTATTEIYTLSLHDALPICSGPKGQLDALFVFLADVVAKRDVQLFLDLRVAFPVPFCEPKEWPVARVIRERFSERMTRREVDAQVLKPLEKVGIVRIEQIAEIHTVRVSAPLEQEIDKIESPGPEREIKG